MNTDLQNNLVILGYIAGAMLLLVWIIQPLFRSGRNDHDAEKDMLQARARSLISSLRTLQSDTSKVSEEDRKNIEYRLYRELALIYERQGLKPEEAVAAPVPVRGETCRCGQALEAKDKFCPACGTPVEHAA